MSAFEPLRFSRLKRMAQSPMHFDKDFPMDSSAIDVGSAADLMILGGTTPVVAYPGKVRRGKEFDKFEADNPSALILTKREFAIAEGMAQAVKAHKDARKCLEGVVQDTLHWDAHGFKCSGTPDVRRPSKFITDLKTGETSDPRRFIWKVRKFAYHAQLAWYREGTDSLGIGCPDCYIVAVEGPPAFAVTVFRITEQSLQLGSRLYRLWIEQLKVCEASGEWPAYSQSVVDLDIPEYEDGEEIEIASAGGDAE